MSASIPDDDDDESMGGIYENGHWYWDEKFNSLVFKSDLPEVSMEAHIVSAILGTVDFKEDIDLNEQATLSLELCPDNGNRPASSLYMGPKHNGKLLMCPLNYNPLPNPSGITSVRHYNGLVNYDFILQQRFRKRIQRKVTEGDVVTLQDVKDVVLFTAPLKILKPLMINLLHLPATERLLRALIFFCQYYLQISDVMSVRMMEEANKLRTPDTDQMEADYLENLEDLRLLVAKEYANMIKELEVNRIFKSPIFNSAEHKMPKNSVKKEISANERAVLLGHCLRKKHKVNTLSPLMNEVHCNRKIDHRIYGLGIVKYPHLSSRLKYMENAISLPENMLKKMDISMGILGLPRSRFDILLREVAVASSESTSSVSVTKTASKIASPSKTSKSGTRKSICGAPPPPLYKDIALPPKDSEEEIGDFPTKSYPRRPCDEVQRKKWILRFLRIAAKYRPKSGSYDKLY